MLIVELESHLSRTQRAKEIEGMLKTQGERWIIWGGLDVAGREEGLVLVDWDL